MAMLYEKMWKYYPLSSIFLFQLFIKTSKNKETALEKNLRGKVNIFLLDEIYLK